MILGWIAGAIIVIAALIWGEKVAKKSVLYSRLPGKVARWKNQIESASSETGVPSQIIGAVIWQESGGDPNAVGAAGEAGLMQLKPIAVEDVQQNFNVNLSTYAIEPGENIRAGAYFLKLMKKREGTWNEALEAYNQGGKGRTQPGKKEKAVKYRNEVNEKLSQLA